MILGSLTKKLSKKGAKKLKKGTKKNGTDPMSVVTMLMAVLGFITSGPGMFLIPLSLFVVILGDGGGSNNDTTNDLVVGEFGFTDPTPNSSPTLAYDVDADGVNETGYSFRSPYYGTYNGRVHNGIDLGQNVEQEISCGTAGFATSCATTNKENIVVAPRDGEVVSITWDAKGKVNENSVGKNPHLDGTDGGGVNVVMKFENVKDNEDKIFYMGFSHLKENSIKVKVGDKVNMGNELAVVGQTGAATGEHLHISLGYAPVGTHSMDTNTVTIIDPVFLFKGVWWECHFPYVSGKFEQSVVSIPAGCKPGTEQPPKPD